MNLQSCAAPAFESEPPAAGTPAPAPRPIAARQLIPQGRNAVEIEHDGQRYTLRLTRANKLILTK